MVFEQVLKDVSERLHHASLFGRSQIGVDTVSDPGGGCLDGITGEMGIAGRRLDLRVPQQLSDHRQPFAER